MGLFDKPWLGITPTRKIAMLRYAEFNRIHDGRIAETAMYFDIPHLMIQAGLQPFPPQTGAHLVQPGPMTHDGVMTAAQPPEEGRKTLAAIDYMVNDTRPGRAAGMNRWSKNCAAAGTRTWSGGDLPGSGRHSRSSVMPNSIRGLSVPGSRIAFSTAMLRVVKVPMAGFSAGRT